MAIDVTANEGGTLHQDVTLTDGNGNTPASIDSVDYSLVQNGSPVNSKTEVDTGDTSASQTITLTGDDLPAGFLYLYVHWVYNSDDGTELPGREVWTIYVEPFRERSS